MTSIFSFRDDCPATVVTSRRLNFKKKQIDSPQKTIWLNI